MSTTTITSLNYDCHLEVLRNFSVVELLSMSPPIARLFSEDSVRRSLRRRRITELTLTGHEQRTKYTVQLEITEHNNNKSRFVIGISGLGEAPTRTAEGNALDEAVLQSSIISATYSVAGRRKVDLIILKLLNAIATNCNLKECFLKFHNGFPDKSCWVTEGKRILQRRRTLDGAVNSRIRGICIHGVRNLLQLLDWFSPAKVFTLHSEERNQTWDFIDSDNFRLKTPNLNYLWLVTSFGIADTQIATLKMPTLVLGYITERNDAACDILVEQWLRGEREIRHISYAQLHSKDRATAFAARFKTTEVPTTAGFKDLTMDYGLHSKVQYFSFRTFLLSRHDGSALQVVFGRGSLGFMDVIRMIPHPAPTGWYDTDLVDSDLTSRLFFKTVIE